MIRSLKLLKRFLRKEKRENQHEYIPTKEFDISNFEDMCDERDDVDVKYKTGEFLENNFFTNSVYFHPPHLQHRYKGVGVSLVSVPDELGISSEELKAAFQDFEGKSIVLANIAPDFFSPYYGPFTNSSFLLPAKEKISRFFREDMLTSNIVFRGEGGTRIYEVDNSSQTMLASGPLTAAYFGACLQDARLLFGRPPEFLVIEHLVLTFSLEELRYFFDLVLKETEKALRKGNGDVKITPDKLHRELISFVKQFFGENIYNKEIEFGMAVLNSLAESFTQSVLMTVNMHLHANFAQKMFLYKRD